MGPGVGGRARDGHAVYDMVLQSVEKPMLEVVMKQANGNQSAAARLLGLSRFGLQKKLKRLGVDPG